ncbi:uncharacterized protein LOC118434336 [Folsomia candida]|nr:uncharacterized protein LOC118434336 [Folsomia candida]
MAAVCGRYSVHLHPITFVPLVELGPLDIATNLPRGSQATPNKLSLICLDLSADSRYLVTADSGRNIYLFEFTPHTWDHVTSWTMDKRTAKVQFDQSGNHIVITDKGGDVFVTTIGSLSANRPGEPVTISTPKRILKHSHHVLDVIFSQDKILTCCSDEMVRVCTYPTIVELIGLGFKLAHKESVVNIALVNRDTNLLSISAEGTLKFWRIWLDFLEHQHNVLEDSSSQSAKSHRCIKSWNIFSILDTERAHANEVVRMAASSFEGRIYVAVLISGFKQLPVFELRPLETTLRLFGQCRLANDFVDLAWRGKNLFVFNPAEANLSKYVISSHGGLMKEEFPLRFSSSVKKDVIAFGAYNRPFFPVKKRVPSHILETVEETKKVLLNEFGPLPSEEEKEAAEALLLAQEKIIEETPEERHARLAEFTSKLMLKKRENKVVKVVMTPQTPEIYPSILMSPMDRHGQSSVEKVVMDAENVSVANNGVKNAVKEIVKLDEISSTQETEAIQTDAVSLEEDDDNDFDLEDRDAEEDLSAN